MTSEECSNSGPVKQLDVCLQRLLNGPWRFIQLRGEPISAADIVPIEKAGDSDVDLLGNAESIRKLLKDAFEWVRSGDCHLRFRCTRSGKRELTFFSTDGQYALRLDLWIEIPQLNHGSHFLTFDDCAAEPGHHQSVERLPPGLEACLYIQHLVCKQRNVTSPAVLQRLAVYVNQCREQGLTHPEMLLQQILQTGMISDECDQQTFEYTQRACRPQAMRQSVRGRLRSLRQSLLRPPRKPMVVSLMGCDGTGKTSLANELQSKRPADVRVITGKHLYRKSLTYKLAVIFLRPLIARTRDRFDEMIAPWAYWRASLSLRFRLLLKRNIRLTLIDRSLADFLMTGRKSDQPTFHQCEWLSEWFGCRIPVVHCVVSHERLMERKQEITVRGHAIYDGQMLGHFTNRVPTDYVLFGNNGPLDSAAITLGRLLESIRRQ